MPPTPIIQLLTDDGMLAHHAPGHPERPDRLAPVADGVADAAAELGAELERPTVEPAASCRWQAARERAGRWDSAWSGSW